jgi:thiamine pyrophosphokinase
LIPFNKDVKGVTTEGLLYPLDKDILQFTATRGISNQMRSSQASIKFDSGLLLCIHQYSVGMKIISS